MIVSRQVRLTILDDSIHHFLITLFGGKEKVGIFPTSHINAFPSIDPVCIHDDPTSLCLTENPCQTNYRNTSGINDISENIARSDTWQLINVAYQNQRHLLRQCF